MGRTNKTYRNHLDSFTEQFKPFKKALRKQNQRHLECLWEKAHKHASAAAYMNPSKPALPAMISVMIGLQKDIHENRRKLEELEEKIG